MKKINYIRILVVLSAAVMLLAGFPAAAGAAELRVQVTLDSTGATSWAAYNIVPGDSGTQKVILRNSGSEAGRLKIWLSNIKGKDGTPAEFALAPATPNGDLPVSLVLNITGEGLQSNLALPAVLNKFPQSADDSTYVTIPELKAGQSVELEWQWALPASVGNEAQGDSLSFDINYGLTTLMDEPPLQNGGGGTIWYLAPDPAPAVSPTPTPSGQTAPEPPQTTVAQPVLRTIRLVLPQSIAISSITGESVLLAPLAASTLDGSMSLSIPAGTKITLSGEYSPEGLPVYEVDNDLIPSVIEAVVFEGLPELPEGWVQVSQAYDINGIAGNLYYGLKLDRPALIVLQYDENRLPEVVDALALFYYNPESGWTQLQPPAGYIAEAGKAAAGVDHFSLFVVLARPGTSARPIIPAHFEIQKLRANPARIMVGQSSVVSLTAANTGGLAGEYMVTVTLDEKVIKAQSVLLKPGEKREIKLILLPETAGLYTIRAGDLSDQLRVDPRPAVDLVQSEWWWLLPAALVTVILVIFIFIRKRLKMVEG